MRLYEILPYQPQSHIHSWRASNMTKKIAVRCTHKTYKVLAADILSSFGFTAVEDIASSSANVLS